MYVCEYVYVYVFAYVCVHMIGKDIGVGRWGVGLSPPFFKFGRLRKPKHHIHFKDTRTTI